MCDLKALHSCYEELTCFISRKEFFQILNLSNILADSFVVLLLRSQEFHLKIIAPEHHKSSFNLVKTELLPTAKI